MIYSMYFSYILYLILYKVMLYCSVLIFVESLLRYLMSLFPWRCFGYSTWLLFFLVTFSGDVTDEMG